MVSTESVHIANDFVGPEDKGLRGETRDDRLLGCNWLVGGLSIAGSGEHWAGDERLTKIVGFLICERTWRASNGQFVDADIGSLIDIGVVV